jgi:hypothetical protein
MISKFGDGRTKRAASDKALTLHASVWKLIHHSGRVVYIAPPNLSFLEDSNMWATLKNVWKAGI